MSQTFAVSVHPKTDLAQDTGEQPRNVYERFAFCHRPEPWFVSVVVKAKPTQTKEGAIEEKVCELVAIRASQLNGCASCLNTFCLRNTSALLPDRFKSFRTTSMNGDSPN